MGYAEAIEQQMALMRRLEKAKGWGEEIPWTDSLMPDGATEEEEVDLQATWRKVNWYLLSVASPFFVSAPICRLIESSARDIPGVLLTRSMFPALHGFVYFESPIVLERYDDNSAPSSVPIGGLVWGLPTWDGEDAAITFYSHYRADGGLSPLYERVGLGSGVSVRDDEPMRILAALCQFMSQSILVTSARLVANRQARKRIANQLQHAPIVHVVELRRRDHQQRDESHDAHSEYSCQWLVRGHWHQYHTRDGLQPRWVAPYVKGPPSKPLKAPTITAYEVVR